MIRAHFGLAQNPFEQDNPPLLPHQQNLYEAVLVHCQQGGFCVIEGEPGTGKSILKKHLQMLDSRRYTHASIGRTLHTYCTILRLLCNALEVDFDGGDHKCEKRIIDETHRLYRTSKNLLTLIDDAHLLATPHLRKLRLLFQEFPRNHCLVLFGQCQLLHTLRLSSNSDLHSRITCSGLLDRLLDEDTSAWIRGQFDQCGLGQNCLTPEALALIARSSQGILRNARNLCISALIEAVRKQTRTVGLEQVNRALLQPHWRAREELENLPVLPAPTATRAR